MDRPFLVVHTRIMLENFNIKLRIPFPTDWKMIFLQRKAKLSCDFLASATEQFTKVQSG